VGGGGGGGAARAPRRQYPNVQPENNPLKTPLSIAVLRTPSAQSMQKSKFGCWPAAGRDLPVFWPSEATFLL
jgi:hypothetical protein